MTRLSAFELPELPSLPRLGGAATRRTGQRTDLTPEEEESLAKKAGRIALGGIGAVGNLLDLPGSSVRDILGGENPLDQWLHPFSGENRTTGRDLLRKGGMIGQEDNWKNWIGGLAGEIALDPLTYVFPFGALTKGGKVVKAAGLMPKVRKLAAEAADVGVTSLGPRRAALRTRVGQVVAGATPEEKLALEAAAKSAGVNLADLAQEPLRGMFGTGFLGKVSHVYGTGPKADKYAGVLDKIGQTVRYGKIPKTNFSPVDSLAQLFNSKLGTVAGEKGQVFAKKAFAEAESGVAKAERPIANFAARLSKEGWLGRDKDEMLLSALEEEAPGPLLAALPPKVQEMVPEIRKYLDEARESVRREGGVIDDYVGDHTRYFPRQGLADEFKPPSAGGAGPTDFRNQFAQPRNPILRPYVDLEGNAYGIKNETTTIRKLVRDEELGEAIEQFKGTKELAAIIERKYGNDIFHLYQDKPGGTGLNRYEALAHWIANLEPAKRKAGLFANSPVADLESYGLRSVHHSTNLRNLRELLLSKDTLFRPGEAARQADWKPLAEALEDVQGHIDPQEFGKKLLDDKFAKMSPADINTYKAEAAARLQQPLANMDDATLIQDLLSHRVSADDAESIGRMMRGFRAPPPVGKILGAFDSLTNLWKGYQTGVWPAFLARNQVSGQANNWFSNIWSYGSLKDTRHLLKGRAIQDAATIPAVAALAAERGITNLTPEAATDLLGEILASVDMTGRYAGETMAQAGIEGVQAARLTEDIANQVPRTGFDTISWKRVLNKFFGREKGTSLNPLAMRGVADFKGGVRTASEFGPAAAGEELNSIVEGFNRIAPMIHQLRKGVDPQEAARVVGTAQAMYSAKYFAAFERDVMKRVFPFYSFSKAMPVWMAQELTQKPGGRLAQMFRVGNRSRKPDAMTPDYVAETMSIPWGGKTPEGAQRYLTGMGLMAEDPVSFLGGGVQGALLEAGSRMNPLLKWAPEWATQQQFFQKGPQGGRQLEDLDPTVGRLLANLTGKRDAVKWPGSQAMEYVLGNSPFSRALTSARTATYPLRALTDPGMKGQFLPEAIKTGLNLGTGFRVTTVSPAAQDALLRERAQKLMKQQGARTFLKTYIPAEVEAQMTPQELRDAQQLEALMNTLSRRGKERSEKWKQATAAQR